MSAKIRAAIIGCGVVAGSVDDPESPYCLSHAKALCRHPQYELAGCYDVEPQKMRTFAAKWKCPKMFRDLDEACDADIDLFIISSSTASHLEIMQRVADSKCKAIILEKPLASSPAELELLRKVAATMKKDVIVNFQRRFDTAHRLLAARLEKFELGKLVSFNAQIGKGLVHNGSHMVDLLFFLLGGVESILPVKCGRFAEDIYGTFLATTAQKTTGVLQCSPEPRYGLFDLDLLYEQGRVALSDLGYSLKVYRAVPWEMYPGFNRLEPTESLEPTLQSAFYELYDLYASRKLNCGRLWEDALKGAEIIFSCMRSQTESR